MRVKYKEEKHDWLGFSAGSIKGRALGSKFATALNENFNLIFNDYGEEKITRSSHLDASVREYSR